MQNCLVEPKQLRAHGKMVYEHSFPVTGERYLMVRVAAGARVMQHKAKGTP